jgi:spore coat protein U-like protein
MRLFCCVVGIGLCQSVWAAPTCTVAASPSLSFGPVIALADTADADANTGSSFWVNCNSEVVAAPTLYSGSERTMYSGASQLPFQLSLSVPGGSELPSQFPGATLDMVNDGSNRTITLHGRLRAADFRSLPAGVYNQMIELTVEY